MPEPLGGRRYAPGLDGLRALAVSAVVAYHLGFGWATGGLLGVGVFFTLSGYLITDILLGGELDLGRFWLARARRLLPGLFVMLAIVTLWVELIGPTQPGFTGLLAGAVFYFSNWQLIYEHVSYFARFGPPGPLDHLWSLAIEEQFYLVWPLLLLVGARLVPERSRVRGVRGRLAVVTLVLAAASAADMALLYRPSLDTSRIYFGTDTRAFELLVGAALAMVWPSRLLRKRVAASARRACDLAGVAGLVTIGLMVWLTNQYSPFLYQGGFVLLSVATALVVAALVHPACRLGRVLGAEPLRWVGVRSYGIYLWHMPVLVLTTPAGDHDVHLWRAVLQVTATVSLAALSWRFVEEPIRRGTLRQTWRLPRPGPALAFQATALATLAVIVGVLTAARSGNHNASGGTSSTTTTTTTTTHSHPPKPPIKHTPARKPGFSSCRSVVDIGDSTSEGLTSPNYLPNPSKRIEAQYDKVGVVTQHYEISGARSIVETYEGEPNAAQVASAWVDQGYKGCWVLALGTNDTANVYAGSNVSLDTRIQQMMSLIGNHPVMWVDLKSLLDSGPYSEQNMELWNEALQRACKTYPNMRIFQWSAVVRDAWFIDDGIHYNTPGYAARARLMAHALARAFPGNGHSSGCVVR